MIPYYDDSCGHFQKFIDEQGRFLYTINVIVDLLKKENIYKELNDAL